MKKLFTLVAGIILSVSTFAQQVPNGGFENWSSPLNPDSWSTIANAYGAAYTSFAVKDTTPGNHIQGRAAVRLFSDSVPTQGIIVSQVGLGRNSPAMGLTFYGYPYAKRPDTLFFFMKYTPGAGAFVDTASLQFNLTKAGVSLFGGVGNVTLTTTSGNWEEVYIPLASSYSTSVTGAPDSLTLIFSSGKIGAGPSVYGSTLWVDSVHFDASVNTTGIADLNGPVLGVNAYPNPVTDQLNIAIQADEVGSSIQLFDMEGRIVYSGILTSTKGSIDTRYLQAGVYAIRVNSVDKLTSYKGKITVTK